VDGKGEFVVDIDIDIEPHVQGGPCGRRRKGKGKGERAEN
jgi:hypothetical protein